MLEPHRLTPSCTNNEKIGTSHCYYTDLLQKSTVMYLKDNVGNGLGFFTRELDNRELVIVSNFIDGIGTHET